MKINQLKGGAILSYLQIFLGILVGILYTPVMIRLLGQSEYGLYNTVASTIAMLSSLKWVFNASYVRFYSFYKKKDKLELLYRLNGVYLIIFCLLGLVTFSAGFYLTNNLGLIFKDGFTAAEYEIAKVLMLLLTINISVSFPMSVFSSIISAYEKFVFLKAVGIITTVISPLVNLPLLLMGFRSIGLVSVTVGISLLTDIIYLIYVIFVLKNKFYFTRFEKGLFKNIFVFSAFIAINTIVDQINLNIGKSLLGRYKGTVSVAIYSVGYYIYQYFMQFSVAISGVFTPRIHHTINTYSDDKERRKEITALFVRVGRLQFLILALLATGIVFFGVPFIRFWAGEEYRNSYYVAVILVLAGIVPLIQYSGIEIQRALDKHKFRSVVYICMAVCNVVICVYSCQKFGAIGAALGFAITQIVGNVIIMNIDYNKNCFINIWEFWKNILSISKGLLLPVVFGIFINIFVKFDSLIKLLAFIIIYTLVYLVSMWFLAMNESEKDIILKPVKKYLK